MFKKKRKRKRIRKKKSKTFFSFECGTCHRIIVNAKELNCPYCKNG